MNLVDQTVRKLENGEPIGLDEARALYGNMDLLTLGQLAHMVRARLNGASQVTFAIDRNINYTNICVSGCRFCAFFRNRDHEQAYVIDDKTLEKKVIETRELGGTHILFQGGLNPDLDLDWHKEKISMIRALGLNVHGYSPPEIIFFSNSWNMTVTEVLEELIKAGLSSIPGGGAEILSDRARQIVSPRKATTMQWLHVMEVAHKLGLKTTATMMFGHVETVEERLEHLFLIRELQDKTGGFTSFIPWTYQMGEQTIQVPKTGTNSYLRILAISRIVLNNVPHIQASWVTQGPHVAQVALHFGADDFGSSMIEENVVSAAGTSYLLPPEEIIALAKEAGFKAHQRDNVYNKAAREQEIP
ncbi:MAG: dehypoxanthine futalosine cyclase [Deltaproteobacteria bacterium]|nr:MAG: dehypoxanthine futalosine cyclase [Deltaproteobacteria bacterium]